MRIYFRDKIYYSYSGFQSWPKNYSSDTCMLRKLLLPWTPCMLRKLLPPWTQCMLRKLLLPWTPCMLWKLLLPWTPCILRELLLPWIPFMHRKLLAPWTSCMLRQPWTPCMFRELLLPWTPCMLRELLLPLTPCMFSRVCQKTLKFKFQKVTQFFPLFWSWAFQKAQKEVSRTTIKTCSRPIKINGGNLSKNHSNLSCVFIFFVIYDTYTKPQYSIGIFNQQIPQKTLGGPTSDHKWLF